MLIEPAAEQNLLLSLLDSERFADVAPAAVFATLLDEGRYHGSIRTMYRLMAAQNQTGERRNQRIHPPTPSPNSWRSANADLVHADLATSINDIILPNDL